MSKEALIEKLRGYKSTPRHCEELCYEASNEIESLRQQLADSQKQVTLLRDALKSIHAIEDKLFGPDWEEIDEARDIVNVALAATADLDGLILCYAELCRDDGRCQYAIDHGAEGLGHCPEGKCCMPLYCARETK